MNWKMKFGAIVAACSTVMFAMPDEADAGHRHRGRRCHHHAQPVAYDTCAQPVSNVCCDSGMYGSYPGYSSYGYSNAGYGHSYDQGYQQGGVYYDNYGTPGVNYGSQPSNMVPNANFNAQSNVSQGANINNQRSNQSPSVSGSVGGNAQVPPAPLPDNN